MVDFFIDPAIQRVFFLEYHGFLTHVFRTPEQNIARGDGDKQSDQDSNPMWPGESARIGESEWVEEINKIADHHNEISPGNQ